MIDAFLFQRGARQRHQRALCRFQHRDEGDIRIGSVLKGAVERRHASPAFAKQAVADKRPGWLPEPCKRSAV